ncbi:hypothetical protein Tco_0634487 [Tanacetum coccineum]
MKMEILLEPTSNKLMVEHAEYDESNTYVLERFNTTAGNPVKKILLKLNLSNHRLFKDGGGDFRYSDTTHLSRSVEVLKLKNFKKDATLKLFKNEASISVMPLSTYLNLGLGELALTRLTVELADKTVKYPKGIAENVLVGIEARLMGETLVLNRSLDPFLEDYIELNDLNQPFELRINQGDDLIPTMEEGEVIEEFRTRNEDLDTGIDDYPRALMNVPIFVGTFSVITNFAILENMDDYGNNEMGDVIYGEPFLREVRTKTRKFDEIITIYNGNDEVSEKDKRSGILPAYQKLKDSTKEL